MIARAAVEALVGERAWAILPSALRGLVAQAAAGASPRAASPTPSRRPGAVAVLPIHGVLLYRPGALAQLFGAISTADLIDEIRTLADDDTIGAIVLDVDSPGGEVLGMPELAAEIRAARDQKRVVAIAAPTAASAAYWLASQASELYCMPSGWVGSIGCFTTHDDLSGAYRMAGVSETLVSAGKYKVEGNELEPLSAEARAYIQTQIVDRYYQAFCLDVALGRHVTPSAVRTGMGEGRMLLAGPAGAAGMIDGQATVEGAISRAVALRTGAPAIGSVAWHRQRIAARGRRSPRATARDVDFYRVRARRRRAS